MKKPLFEGRYRAWMMLLIIGAILVNIKSIFMDYDVDSEYAVAMAYRMLKGDMMIAQMWEPHQTSAFLCSWLMKPYISILGTTTGIVLYLHTLGVFIRGGFTWFIYRTLKNRINPRALFFMCIYFFSVSPKWLSMPEFSNMQLWFSVGVFCCLIRFFEKQKEWWWLLGAGIFLFAEVMAYPSCVIVYIGVIILLFLYSEKKWINSLLLTGTCLVMGGGLCAWIFSYTGWERFLENLSYIVTGDEFHDESLFQKFGNYLLDFGRLMLILLILFLVAVILAEGWIFLVKRRKGSVSYTRKECWGYFAAGLLLCFIAVHAIMAKERYDYVVIYIPIILFAIMRRKDADDYATRVITTGMFISLLSGVATLLLSNLPMTSSMNYLILAVCVSFIPMIERLENGKEISFKRVKYGMVWLFCLITIFRSGYIFKPMNDYIAGIFRVGGIVKDGPALGIVSEYMGPYIINVTMEEWEQYVEDGDKVLLVGNTAVSTIGYLYKDTEISVDSTICTPTYDEKLLKYWEQNPQKYPNVVVVSCWFGELKVAEDSWIMQWLETEFRADTVIDGQYYRYYLKNES